MAQQQPAKGQQVKSAKPQTQSPLAHYRSQRSAPTPLTGLSHATVQRTLANPRTLSPNDILQLQRTVGNQAVNSILRGQSDKAPAIQGKLQVGPAHDQYEVEAQQVAGNVAQRQNAGEIFAPDGGAAPQEVEKGIRSARGSGSALPTGIRRSMEGSLDTDLGTVRLHTDARADKLNRSLSAKAFTTGKDLFFRKGEYQPESKAGRSLLAHELTHVKQQSGGIERAPMIRRKLTDKKDQIEGQFKALFPNGDRAAVSKAYMDKFDTKPTDKGKRKEQKREKKALKKLLHYKHDEDRVDDAGRLKIRSLLIAEAAAGANMATLAEFKRFLTDNYTAIKPQTLSSYWKPDGSAGGAIIGLIELATKWGASDNLINLFYSHSADFRWRKIDPEITSLTTQAHAISARAEQATKTGDPRVTGMLSYKRRQMLKLADQLAQLQAQRNLYRVLPLLPRVKEVFDVVLSFTLHAERSGNVHSSSHESAPAKQLGGGNFSKVYEVHYDKKLAPEPNKVKMTHGVFKQELTHYGEDESPTAFYSGIQNANPNFTGRSVATYKLDKLMGMGVTPKTKVGTHGGMSGSVQDWVEGKAPQKTTVKKGDLAAKFYSRDFNMDDPEIQRQLSTLQLLDVITGQVDRHEGNYFIYQGPNGTQVKSIDNDLAFGKDKGIEQVKDEKGFVQDKDASKGLPLFIDKDVADRLTATTPDQIKNIVQAQGLSPEEVNKTLERFARVKQHITELRANTVRLGVYQQQYINQVARQQNQQDGGNAPQDDGLELLRQQIRELQAKGAILNKGAWGKVSAKYSTLENSYYGRALYALEYARTQGTVIGKDEK